MPPIHDHLADLSMTVESDDGLISSRISFGSPPTVSIDPMVGPDSTAQDLGDELEDLINETISGYQSKIDALTGGRPLPGRIPNPIPIALQRRIDIAEAIDAYQSQTESPRRFVIIDWKGAGDIALALKSDILDRLSIHELVTEVNAALATATKEYATFTKSVYKQHYTYDRFGRHRRDT